MKDFIIKTKDNKLLMIVDNSIYEKEAIILASYKYTDKCYINIKKNEGKKESIYQSIDAFYFRDGEFHFILKPIKKKIFDSA